VGAAVLPVRWRSAVDWGRLAPPAIALAFGLLYLLFEPRPGDLAAHVFRAELFGREGFTIWNGDWYGGHHTPAYSVLVPPLSWLVGPRVLLVGSCVACAAWSSTGDAATTADERASARHRLAPVALRVDVG
jgi:hypothetical protein